jgi:hypothetical protein
VNDGYGARLFKGRLPALGRLLPVGAEPMAGAVSWLEEFKQFWSSSFDQLDGLLEELKKAERKGQRRKGRKNE